MTGLSLFRVLVNVILVGYQMMLTIDNIDAAVVSSILELMSNVQDLKFQVLITARR